MINISPRCPEFWEEKCNKHKLFFFSSSWQQLLSDSLNVVEHLYITDQDRPVALINIFSRYTFRAAYINFPTGVLKSEDEKIIESVYDSVLKNVDLIRFDVITDNIYTKQKQTLPRTVIPELTTWEYEKLPAPLKRNIKKSKKSNVTIEAGNKNQAAIIYEIYCSVLKRHGGKAKYNQKYFNDLLDLHLNSELLNIYIAYKEEQVTGYICVATHDDTAVYLHGGIFLEYSSYRPMDYLFLHAISEAKEKGVNRFDFLASPEDQHSLVRYKEKWGGITKMQNRIGGYASNPRAALLKLLKI